MDLLVALSVWVTSQLLCLVRCALRKDRQKTRKHSNIFSIPLSTFLWMFTVFCANILFVTHPPPLIASWDQLLPQTLYTYNIISYLIHVYLKVRDWLLSAKKYRKQGKMPFWKLLRAIVRCLFYVIYLSYVFHGTLLACNVRPRPTHNSGLQTGERQAFLLCAWGVFLTVNWIWPHCSLSPITIDCDTVSALMSSDVEFRGSCLQGSVAIAGAVVRWLKDNMGIVKTTSEIGSNCDMIEILSKMQRLVLE